MASEGAQGGAVNLRSGAERSPEGRGSEHGGVFGEEGLTFSERLADSKPSPEEVCSTVEARNRLVEDAQRLSPNVELHLTTGRELFEADFVYLLTGQPL